MKILSAIRSNELLKHSSILFGGMMVVHVSNMVYQMVVGRVLPSEEYALLAAFLGVLAILQRPLGTLQTSISHYSSILKQDHREGDIKRLLKKWLLLTGGPALFFGTLMILFSETLAIFFHIDRTEPIIIVGAIFPAMFLVPIMNGTIQGMQRFGWASISAILGAFTRLALGAGLVCIVYPACGWAMLGHGLSIYMTLGILCIGVAAGLKGVVVSDYALPSMRYYMLQSLCIQAAYAVLMTADVILVKHYFPNDRQFAFAATLGRMIVFLPGAIAVAMFPKVASKGTTSDYQKSTFLKSFYITFLFVICAVAGCWLFAGLVAEIIFGISEPSPYLKSMIRAMSAVMALAALLNVTIQYLVAQRRFFGAWGVVVFAVLYIVATIFNHETAFEIVVCAAITNLGALLATLFFCLKRGRDE